MCIFIIKIFYNLIFIIVNFSILTRLDHKLTMVYKNSLKKGSL